MSHRLRLAACAAALCATQALAQPSADSLNKLAALINLSGQLCARVTSVRPMQPNVYNVECTRYRDGTGTATYVVDLNTGQVK